MSDPVPSRRTEKVRNRRLRNLRQEHRSVRDIEIRHADDDAIVLTGTPIVYDTPYKVNGATGSFSETVQRGAASHLLNSDVVLAWNHDTDAIPLARTSSGTLKLTDRAHGVDFEARLDPRNPSAVALESAVERGDVSQMSIGFTVAQDKWTGTGQTRSRSIGRFGSLVDISPVVWPASPTTSVSVLQRAMMTAPDETLADFDRIYTELRAGRVLSSDNEDALKTALQSLHEVLSSNGFDTAAFLGGVDDNADEDVDEEADEAEMAGEDRSAHVGELEMELELVKARSALAHITRRHF
jgi:HK97 family phage prohead protease